MKYLIAILTLSACALAADVTPAPEPKLLYVAPMNGLENYIAAALIKKHVPVTVVTEPAGADLRLEVAAESQKAGWAKILLTKDTSSSEEISIRLVAKDGTVKYAYAYHRGSTFHGKQSAAESCAVHLRDYLKKGN